MKKENKFPVSWIFRTLGSLMIWGSLFILLFLTWFILLPANKQDQVVNTMLDLAGMPEETSIETFATLDPYVAEPRLITGFQMLTDSIVSTRKLPFCPPAKTICVTQRKASYIYEIETGDLEIEIIPDSISWMYIRPKGNSRCEATIQPELSARQLQNIQDSSVLIFNLPNQLDEDILLMEVEKLIKTEHLKWKLLAQ